MTRVQSAKPVQSQRQLVAMREVGCCTLLAITSLSLASRYVPKMRFRAAVVWTSLLPSAAWAYLMLSREASAKEEEPIVLSEEAKQLEQELATVLQEAETKSDEAKARLLLLLEGADSKLLAELKGSAVLIRAAQLTGWQGESQSEDGKRPEAGVVARFEGRVKEGVDEIEGVEREKQLQLRQLLGEADPQHLYEMRKSGTFEEAWKNLEPLWRREIALECTTIEQLEALKALDPDIAMWDSSRFELSTEARTIRDSLRNWSDQEKAALLTTGFDHAALALINHAAWQYLVDMTVGQTVYDDLRDARRDLIFGQGWVQYEKLSITGVATNAVVNVINDFLGHPIDDDTVDWLFQGALLARALMTYAEAHLDLLDAINEVRRGPDSGRQKVGRAFRELNRQKAEEPQEESFSGRRILDQLKGKWDEFSAKTGDYAGKIGTVFFRALLAEQAMLDIGDAVRYHSHKTKQKVRNHARVHVFVNMAVAADTAGRLATRLGWDPQTWLSGTEGKDWVFAQEVTKFMGKNLNLPNAKELGKCMTTAIRKIAKMDLPLPQAVKQMAV